MAMMISKFHKLIQSKLVWIIFLTVIIISFVFWGMFDMGTGGRDEQRVAGRLDGRNVSLEEFRNARANTYLALAIMLGQPPRMTREMDEEIDASAWRRVAALRTAEAMGFSAGNDEVRETIKSLDFFVDEQGRFSPRAYQYFVQQFLRSLGMNELHFEQYIREEIIMQKLRMMAAQGLLIAPHEVRRTFEAVNDVFDVSYVLIEPKDVEDRIDEDMEQVRAYFESHRERFMIPPRVSVRYVRFPVADYIGQTDVGEEDALAYYDRHLDAYTRLVPRAEEPGEEPEDEGTGADEADRDLTDLLAAALDGDQAALEEVVTPFEDVREDIMESLRRQQALNLAAEKATDFVVALYPDRQGQAPSFEEAARRFDLPIEETLPFALGDPVEDVDAGQAFNRAAHDLRPSPEDYFSNAVLGEEYAYVLALMSNYAERLPEFDEVVDRVRPAYEADAVIEAMHELAQTFHQEARKALDEEGGSFEHVAQRHGFEVTSVDALTLLEADEDEPYIADLVSGILTRNAGELTEPLPTEQGLLLVYVAERRPGTVVSLGTLRPQIIEALKRERYSVLLRDWEDYLLKRGSFEDRLAAASEFNEAL